MGRHWFVGRACFVIAALMALPGVPGCADGGDGGRRDGGGTLDGSADSGGGIDAFVPPDTGPTPDTGVDGGPEPTLLTCESCTEDWQCVDGYCATLVTGGSACLPGCIPDLPECPRSFSCIFDASGTGVDATICAPVGGPCCVDEDGDGYGQGVGCTDTDCNDTDPEVHPDRTEICDGRDTNCNGTIDEPPTDCEAGFCRATGAGDYEATTSAVCSAASCGSGTSTACALYTCSEGGAEGLACATSCANPTTGEDDDTFCIATAHCDASVCVPDVVDGGTCDEDTDCSTSHCDSDICCASGDCCTDATDCPGGGSVTRLCETPADCQGSRGEAMCTPEFRCMTTSGIPDDSGCGTSVTARDCGLYDPIICTGAENQTPRACPISCVGDADCVDAAHCSVGHCVPDLPPGGPCGRNADCQDGLSCADNVCCTSACTGSCQSCNLPGTAGNCMNIPAGGDPNSECAGFSCGGYYTGFESGDICYRRADVDDAAATCDGSGLCRSPDLLCSTRPIGPVQIDCNNSCQTPTPGTCTGSTPGACTNLDNTSVFTTCGTGACLRSVQACMGGVPGMCSPGTPTVETCNTVDDDCDGAPDDGPGAALCPTAPGADAYTCSAGACSFSCLAGRANLNGSYTDGCECTNDAFGSVCAAATALAAVGPAATVNGSILATGEEDWFSVTFPSTGRGPVQGTPQIRLTGATAGNFVLDFFNACGAPATCGAGGPTGVGSWTFTDNQSSGLNAYTGGHTTAWPGTVLFRVRRVAGATTCAAASYTLTLGR